MNIIVSVNSKYVRYLFVMLTSLYENNVGNDIVVYVMNRNLTEQDKEYLTNLSDKFGQDIRFLKVDEKIFEGLPVSEKFSVEAYFRLAMGSLLPETVGKALYLDVDIIVQGDLKELYDIEVNTSIAAVCQDAFYPMLTDKRKRLFRRKNGSRYFNSGVMLWNISKLREEYSLARFIDAANELNNDLQFVDQEILNYLLYDKVKYIDGSKYNYMVHGDVKLTDISGEDVLIMHFAGCNPWQNGRKNELYRVWWDYAKLTPFYTELLEENLWREMGIGDEKHYEMLRDMEARNIYEWSFRLKGTGKVRNYIESEKLRIIMYGAGAIGESLYELFKAEDIWDKVDLVVDCNREEDFHGKKVINTIDGLTDALVIVTPIYRSIALVNSIKASVKDNCSVISYIDWLKDIE